jgi:hypothetical protein
MKRKRVEQQSDHGAILPYTHHSQTCCEARRHEADEASWSLSLQAGVAVFYGSSALSGGTKAARYLRAPREMNLNCCGHQRCYDVG